MVRPIVFQSDVVGPVHLQVGKQVIQRRWSGILLVFDCAGTEHLHDHCKVLLVLRRFIVKVVNQRRQQHGSRGVPKGIIGLTALRRGRLEQIGDKPLDVVVALQIDEGIVAMALFHRDQVKHPDFILFL